MSVTPNKLVADLRRFITPSYPDMEIRVMPWDRDPARLAIYFTDAKFALIYPYQRWHYLTHLIPADYQRANLENSVWFELAPGEKPEDLRYPDEELIDSIIPDVMKCLNGARFFELLDDAICPKDSGFHQTQGWGIFRISRPFLPPRGSRKKNSLMSSTS